MEEMGTKVTIVEADKIGSVVSGLGLGRTLAWATWSWCAP
jgi:hypothetical protein